jgi:hypothetical protein
MARPFTRPSLRPSPLTPRRLAGLDHNRCFASLRGWGRTRKRRGKREITSRAADTALKETREDRHRNTRTTESIRGIRLKPLPAESRVDSTYGHTKRYKHICAHGLPRRIELDWLCPHRLNQTRSPQLTSFTANILVLGEPSLEAYKVPRIG